MLCRIILSYQSFWEIFQFYFYPFSFGIFLFYVFFFNDHVWFSFVAFKNSIFILIFFWCLLRCASRLWSGINKGDCLCHILCHECISFVCTPHRPTRLQLLASRQTMRYCIYYIIVNHFYLCVAWHCVKIIGWLCFKPCLWYYTLLALV